MEDDVRYLPLHRLTGAIITAWTHTEWILLLLLAEIANIDDEKARMILAAQTNFRTKRELILRMGLAYLPDVHLAEFEAIMARVKHLSEKRNMLAHSRAFYQGRSTFRFMNDQDPTQPETFGRYQDVQLGNLRVWLRELKELHRHICAFDVKIIGAQMLTQPRLIPKPSDDPAP